jgi:O-antigen/teichoic acid export membrane protein
MRSLARRLVHGSLWSLAARLLSIGATMLGTVLLTRYLSTVEMGIFFLAISLVNVAKKVGQYGLMRVAVRRISEALALYGHSHAARVGRDLMAFGLLFMLFTSLLMWLFVLPALPQLIDMTSRIAELKDYVIVWAAALVVLSLSTSVLRGFHEDRAASLVGTALAPVLVALGYLFVFYIPNGDNLKTVLVLTAIMHVIAAILAFTLLRRPLNNPVHIQQQGWKDFMSGATPFWINSVTMFVLSSAGLWVLGVYHTESDVAIYGAAMKLIAVAVGMVNIVQPILQPAISDAYARKDYIRMGRALRTSGLVTGLPTILICIILIAFPGLLMEQIFGAPYREGAAVLAALSAGYLIVAFIGMPGIALDMTDGQKQYMFATLATSTATLVVILLIITDHGPFWLAVVVSAGLVFQRLVFWAMLRRHVQVRSDLFAARFGDLKLAIDYVVQILLRRGSRRDDRP